MKKVGSSKVQIFDLPLQQDTFQRRHLQLDCPNCQATWRNNAGRHLHNRHKLEVIADSSPKTVGESSPSYALVSGIQRRRAYTIVLLWYSGPSIAPSAYLGLGPPFPQDLLPQPPSVLGSSRLERTHPSRLHFAVVDRRKRRIHDRPVRLLCPLLYL